MSARSRSPRVIWPWLGLAIVLGTLAIASGFFLNEKLNSDLDMAHQRGHRELKLVAIFLGNALQAGRYQDAQTLINEWGEANPNIAELQLKAANGFIIAEYRSPYPRRGTYTLDTPLIYAYHGQARLTMRAGVDQVYDNHGLLVKQLVGVFAILAILMAVLTLLTIRSYRASRLLLARNIEANDLSIALRQSNERLRLALHAGQMGCFDWDIVRDRIVWTEEHARLFGITLAEFDGRYASFAKYVHPQDLPRVQQGLIDAQQTHQFYQAEFRIIWPDGSLHWVAGRGEFFYNDAGDAQRMVGIMMDITDRKQVDLALQESERQFRTLLETVQLVGVILDSEGKIVLCNDFLLVLTGWRREEVLQKNWFEVFVPPEIREDLKNSFFRKGFRSGSIPTHYENEIVTRDAQRRVIAWNNTLLRSLSGEPLQIASIGEDITERKKAERALIESEEHFRLLFEQATDGIFITNANGSLLDVNSAACQLTGYFRSELLKMGLSDLLPLEETARVAPAIKEAHIGSQIQGEWEFKRKDGTSFIAEISAKWLSDGRLQAFFRDITARKLSEKRLLEEIEKRRVLLNSAEDGIFVLDKDFRVVETNPGFAKLLGLSVQETLGLHPWDWDVNYSTEDILRATWPELPSEPQHFETQIRASDGHIFEAEISGSPATLEQGETLMLFICRDITLRKDAERALRESEQQMHRMINSLFVYVGIMTPEGILLEANQPPLEQAGLVAEDVIGMAIPDCPWWSYSSEVQARMWRAIRRAAAGESVRYEERARMLDKYVTLDLAFTPMRNTEGRITHIIPSAVDITERKKAEAELRQLMSQLEQRVAERTAELAEKNRELETFTYSVSHDLKAPLRGIDGYSRLLLTDYMPKLDEQGRFFVQTIRDAAQQMAQLIDDLLAYSRIERREMHGTNLDLTHLVNKLLSERRAEIDARHVEIVVQIDCEGVYAEREGLLLALRNLLDNALKFTQGELSPKIVISAITQEQNCLLWVSDNGPGFEMQYHERIFEIFQRLHRSEEFPGTGVGLAIVRKAVQRMRGRTWAESEPGKGATFFIELPTTERGNPYAL